ncbi:MAG TPA: hypothetical protein VL171_15270 [Verrucomicrobiae bacterium]|nr:hypothetical protein [Verrucomicrobiae bacterium]
MSPPSPATNVEDYKPILSLRGPDHLPRIIVGGQAVNIWAERYRDAEPRLDNYLPFTSKDLDLLGDASDLHQIATETGFKKMTARREPIIPSAGYLEMPLGDAGSVKIEILKRMYGVTTEEAREAALVIEHKGLQLRVLHPITLLTAKAEAAVHLPQNKPGQERQDVRHLQMMVLCVRSFLREQIVETEAGELEVRDCLDLHQKVLKVLSSYTAGQARRKYGIDWLEIMPVEALKVSREMKLRNFVEQRWHRWAVQHTKRSQRMGIHL